jgi:hypothetical protein
VATAGGAATASASPTATLSDSERRLKFAACMRDHGVDLPDPTDDGNGGGVAIRVPDGTDPKSVDAAMQQCKAYLPNGGKPPTLDAAQLEQVRKFAACMRDHGVTNFPDPDADGRLTITGGPGSGLDPKDPTFAAAMTACQKYQPRPAGGGAITDSHS